MPVCRLPLVCFFLIVSVAACAMPAAAQTAAPSPALENSDYLARCRQEKFDCRLEFKEPSEDAEKPPARTYDFEWEKPFSNSANLFAIILVLILLVTGLALWLRFGNGGVLLGSTPQDKSGPDITPENWRQSLSATSTGDLLQQIAAMTERRQALIVLLRHCLLYAADKSNTRLARSDTERMVLRRLPQTLSGRGYLENLLRETELAHYGGREVVEERFSALLTAAGEFLFGKQAVS